MPAPVDELLSKRLAGLPPVAGGAHGWQAVQQKLHRRERMAVRRRQAARLSLAASVVVLACLAAFDVVQRPTEPDVIAPLAAAAKPAAAETSEMQQLRAKSVALEQLLAAMPDRPAVVRADSALPIDSLEAQVQWLDHQLSVGEGDAGNPEQAAQLWRERVEVMNSLVLLRYAEAQRVAM
jgi:hypothetical protein